MIRNRSTALVAGLVKTEQTALATGQKTANSPVLAPEARADGSQGNACASGQCASGQLEAEEETDRTSGPGAPRAVEGGSRFAGRSGRSAHWVFGSVLLTLILSSIATTRAAAQDGLLSQEQAAFRQASNAVAPSVVQIEIFGGQELAGGELIAEGPTTGTIVGADGWIVSTLYSFRQQPASILVNLPDESRAPARIVARDFSRELVLLKIDVEQELPVAPTADSSPVVGQWVVALGKTYDKVQATQSVGIISAMGRAYDKALQTDAKVSPINYGGPLVDLQGGVVGILSPISPGAFLEGDSSQLYDSGIGFAIPMRDILERLPRLRAGEDIHSGKLGVVAAEQNELQGPVNVIGATPGSPAAKVGLRAGDTIVEAGGRPVTILAHLLHALGPIDAGEAIEIVAERNGERLGVEPQLVQEIPIYRKRYLGLRVQPAKQGLRIVAIEPDSPAADSPLEPGQILIDCDGTQLKQLEDLSNLLAVAELDRPLRLQVEAGEETQENRAEGNAASKDASATNVEFLPVEWPQGLPPQMPPVDDEIAPDEATEVVDVILGDFPNKSFAVVPPMLEDARPLGLLILFAEPGEVDATETQEYWSDFCRDYGWIVAIIQSGNPRVWSREEVELASRVLGRLDNNYAIDRARTVIGGLGVGGRVAVAAAAAERQRVSGVITLGTSLPPFQLRQRNAPLQSLDFLFVGDAKALEQTAQPLREEGYAADVVAAQGIVPTQWGTLPTESVRLWLEGLGRL